MGATRPSARFPVSPRNATARSTSLPGGLREAREIADILQDGDDQVDVSVRGLFRSKMALGPVAAAADLVAEFGDEARRLIADIETRVI
jgi:hypothetical protein